MSMSMHVILEAVPSRAVWQSAIVAAGFKLALDPNLDTMSNTGFVPAVFDEIDTGFEFYVATVLHSVPEYLPFARLNDPRKLSANFRWGGDILEMCCAYAAAAALAKVTGGVLFQGEDNSISAGDEAIKAAEAEISAAHGMY